MVTLAGRDRVGYAVIVPQRCWLMGAWTGYYLHTRRARNRDFMLRKAPCSKASGKASERCIVPWRFDAASVVNVEGRQARYFCWVAVQGHDGTTRMVILNPTNG